MYRIDSINVGLPNGSVSAISSIIIPDESYGTRPIMVTYEDDNGDIVHADTAKFEYLVHAGKFLGTVDVRTPKYRGSFVSCWSSFGVEASQYIDFEKAIPFSELDNSEYAEYRQSAHNVVFGAFSYYMPSYESEASVKEVTLNNMIYFYLDHLTRSLVEDNEIYYANSYDNKCAIIESNVVDYALGAREKCLWLPSNRLCIIRRSAVHIRDLIFCVYKYDNKFLKYFLAFG